ncbi:predicted protein [Plenodomus lingam JN3]|uniref:Predicted protein n=1 Tax=Leptosphaeria maculans (strain JN3 / isolate v23.1.3 / race Av1-4-5-6-7-8) TaxID=985895 RepID=E4ZNQ7_LEPMJ|nr:predicted protein [Plenodomus lingam JN3]CBX93276.1 predicted protein [Plenodomus lingam JN3]
MIPPKPTVHSRISRQAFVVNPSMINARSTIYYNTYGSCTAAHEMLQQVMYSVGQNYESSHSSHNPHCIRIQNAQTIQGFPALYRRFPFDSLEFVICYICHSWFMRLNAQVLTPPCSMGARKAKAEKTCEYLHIGLIEMAKLCM